MKKVIFLNTFTGYNRDVDLYTPGTNDFYLFGMGQFIAQEFYKRDYPVVFENWRMDLRINKILEKKIEGIHCKIFPSQKRKFIGEFSNQLVDALKQEAGKNDVVFHFIPNHKINYHFFARIIKDNTVVATHIGGANPLWLFRNERKWKSLIYYWLEKYFLLLPYNHFIASSKTEVEYYKQIGKRVLHMPLFGISRENHFFIKDREQCRKKLNLPSDKRILLQVGRADLARGFDWIMELIDYYKEQNEYLLLFVGVDEVDDYYTALIEKGVKLIPTLTHTALVDYYNAADLLYYLPHGKMDLCFAGTSYVPLEALACGTPVVATTFHHFPGNEVEEVSRIPKSKEEVIPMIEELLQANVSRERCSEIVLKEFDWDEITKKHYELYTQ